MRRTYSYSRQTVAAAELLGLQIAQGRRERRLTAAELAERAGISVLTLRKAERGDPTVALGTMFELAGLAGVVLFTPDAAELAARTAHERDRLRLLPARIREPAGPVEDDF
jgi:transcriptional regulator with XRE-family HTH domain